MNAIHGVQIPKKIEENPEVEAFIFNNDLNERAADALRTKSKIIQDAVLSRGPLNLASNPHAACLQRIKYAQINLKASGGTIATQSSIQNAQIVEQFIVDNKLDERAAGAMREKREEIQNYVISRGSLLHERNPSVACLLRIKQAQQQCREQGFVLPWNHDGSIEVVQKFIKDNGIDDKAGALLIEKSKEIQEHVMARGDFSDAHNPSAVCMLRIKDAEKAIKSKKEKQKQQDQMVQWSYDGSMAQPAYQYNYG